MNKLFFLFTIIVCSMSYAQKKTGSDLWSGSYVMISKNEDQHADIDTLIIKKTADADPDKIPAKYTSDLVRWSLSSAKEGDKDQQTVKRFLFDIEHKKDAYAEFGWTNLHKSGKMNCIDGGHFFICQTDPNTEVKFSKEEKFFTKTGIFGIWLHYGLVELKKIK